jgi:hypothetical protein
VDSDEGFRRSGDASTREKKRGEGGVSGLFIAGVILQKGLGFGEGDVDRAASTGAVHGQDYGARKREKLTGGAQLSAREGEGRVPIWVWGVSGPWVLFGAGPDGSPRPHSPCFLFFYFPFSYFFFSFISFA